MSSKYPIILHDLGILNVLGNNKTDVAKRLFAGDCSGLQPVMGWLAEGPAHLGLIQGELPALPSFAEDMRPWQSRNNQLLLAAFQQIEDTYQSLTKTISAARIGVIIGTSTSGVVNGELAHTEHEKTGQFPVEYHYNQQEMGNPAEFLARYLGLRGPTYAISTACTSSANAFVSARALLWSGVCDVVLVGGVDSMCKLTVQGFTSLESTSAVQTNPLSQNRCGINIGEGAALFVVSRPDLPGSSHPQIALIGAGESNDAHHMSAPDPTGQGARRAMQAALTDAALIPQEIDYVNLHATATPKNDAMESLAMHQVFPHGVPCSGTKPMTGHTLGAAGATEAGFCWLTLSDYNPGQILPPHIWDAVADPALPTLNVVERTPAPTLENQASTTNPKPLRICMSNSFAFGGSNASLIISKYA